MTAIREATVSLQEPAELEGRFLYSDQKREGAPAELSAIAAMAYSDDRGLGWRVVTNASTQATAFDDSVHSLTLTEPLSN